MRAGLFALVAMLLLAVMVSQGVLSQTTEAESTPSITARCSGSDVDCSTASPDAVADVIVEHTTYLDGCAPADLHLARYVSAGGLGGEPVVAVWCAVP